MIGSGKPARIASRDWIVWMDPMSAIRTKEALIQEASKQTALDASREIANSIYYANDNPQKIDFFVTGNAINPFFVPEARDGLDPTKVFNADAYRKCIAMARLAAANSTTTKVLYSSAPKSGSTFVSHKIGVAFNLIRVCMTLYSASSMGDVNFGGAIREANIDEMALLGSCLLPQGVYAQHHIACTPLTANYLKLYNVVPILSVRNIFDTLISYDDHFRRALSNSRENPFMRYGMPSDYLERDFDDRIDVLIDMKLAWYMKYMSTWQACEKSGLVDPLWIVYERDILGDKTQLAQRIGEKLKRPLGDILKLAVGLSEKDGMNLNVNKAVAGRGEHITSRNRQRIEDFFHRYRREGDFSAYLNA